MAKVTYENLSLALKENNEWLKKYIYDVITNFSPTSTNVAKILSHLTNTTIHVTKEDKDLWDSTLDKAKEYVDESLKDRGSIEFKVVDNLPTTDIVKSAFYLLKTDQAEVYEQYIYADTGWVFLGETSIDLSNYYTKDQIDEIVNDLKSAAQHSHENKEILDLVTAAFTIEEKQLLATLAGLDATSIKNHMLNSQIHLSETQIELLSSITNLDVQSISNHLINTEIHITSEQAEKWDGILEDAKSYTNEMISSLLVAETYDSLPNNPNGHTIYMVPAETPTQNHLYDKYIYVNGAYDLLGGGSSGGGDIDLSGYATIAQMESYVSIVTHNHSNLDILSQITAPFTTELNDAIAEFESIADASKSHIGDNNIHMSQDEKSKLENLDATIESKVSTEIEKANTFTIVKVDELPTVLSEVNENVIYFVRRSAIPEDLTIPNDISNIEKAVNYDKYVWSSEFGCWEMMEGTSNEITDEEIEEILNS